jgi:hypothetical protein
MPEPSHPSRAFLPAPDAESAIERPRAEITIRIAVLVLLGSIVAAWEAWRVVSSHG